MADIAYPTTLVAPARFTLALVHSSVVTRAAFGNWSQVASIPGARWRFEAEWRNLRREEADQVRALLLQCRGGANALTLFDFAQPSFRGAGGGSPVVNGAGQSGNTLSISGATASVTGWARAGDKIQVGNYLYMIVADADTNASGQATLQIEPALRVAPSNGAAITTAYPRARFMVFGEISWTHEVTLTVSLTSEGIEAL